MSTVRIFSIIAWTLIAASVTIMAIVDFTWFYVFMAVGCGGVAILSYLEYLWSRDNTWQEGD